MAREEMVARVIYKYGFEHEMTIAFSSLCEKEDITDNFVLVAYDYAMNIYQGE